MRFQRFSSFFLTGSAHMAKVKENLDIAGLHRRAQVREENPFACLARNLSKLLRIDTLFSSPTSYATRGSRTAKSRTTPHTLCMSNTNSTGFIAGRLLIFENATTQCGAQVHTADLPRSARLVEPGLRMWHCDQVPLAARIGLGGRPLV